MSTIKYHTKASGLGFTALVCAIALCSVSVVAEESPEAVGHVGVSVDERELEKTDVIGFQSAPHDTQMNVDDRMYTGFVQSLGREAFEDRLTTLNDILEALPAVQLKSSGGIGSFASASIRGSTGKQVNIFLDGVLLNSPFSGSINMAKVPSALVETVSVYPSFTPIELSSANLAGAVNITSRNVAYDQAGGQLSLAYGSFDTQSAELSGWGEVSDWQLLGSYSYLEAENDYPVSDDAFDTKTDTRVNDDVRSNAIFLKAARDWGDVGLKLVYQAQDFDKGIPTQLNRQADNASLDVKSQQFQAVVDYQLSGWQLSHRVLLAEEDTVFDDPNGTVGLRQDTIVTDQSGYGLFSLAKYAYADQSVVLGLDLRGDDIYQEDITLDELKADVSREAAVLSAAHNWQPLDVLFINTTLRYYDFNDIIHGHESTTLEDGSNSATAWHIGFKARATGSLHFLANIGQTVRMPTLLEKFGNTGLYIGNEELTHELAKVIDAGLVYQSGRWHFTSSFYLQQVEEGIYMIYDSSGVGRPENIGESLIFGNDSLLSIAFAEDWSLILNSNLKDSENQSGIKAFDGKKMPGLYHINYGAALNYRSGIWGLNTRYQFYDMLYYNPANAVEADEKGLWDLSATVYLDPVTLDLTFRNLLDERYMDFNRQPAAGQSAHLTAIYTF